MNMWKTICEVTYVFVTKEDNKRHAVTFYSEQGDWYECHDKARDYAKRVFHDKGIELAYQEIINTASSRVPEIEPWDI